MLKYVVLLAVALAVAEAFLVCPNNFCDKVKCENLDNCLESNGMKIREKGGFCQCCDICIRVLGLGERCGTIQLGIVNPTECASGLECHRDLNICVESTH